MAWPLLLPVVLLAFGIHALPQPGFGFHRDELLYFAMGDHLEFLRMQFPPLIAVAARVMKGIFGDSVVGARLLPALAHGALIILTAAMARAMGGAARSQLLAALGVLVALVFVRAGTLFQPVVFEMLWWSIALLALLELLSAGPRHSSQELVDSARPRTRPRGPDEVQYRLPHAGCDHHRAPVAATA